MKVTRSPVVRRSPQVLTEGRPWFVWRPDGSKCQMFFETREGRNGSPYRYEVELDAFDIAKLLVARPEPS